MAVRKEAILFEGLYFVTLTCARWIPLFEEIQAYDSIYKWFDVLKTKGNFIVAYVLMPNHLHMLGFFKNQDRKTINSIIGNGKRFLAYAIVNKLKETHELERLDQLKSFVTPTDWKRGKLHEVFQPSFDWKRCWSKDFFLQKLHYIHQNPCRGVWNLAAKPELYKHSSAKYYNSGIHSAYEVTDFKDLSRFLTYEF
jgi:REP element-mobilizing transposase RayT